ncbi:NRDE family protein [uncultured Methylibium sp.]|uniref:NRDE family protein n=1 Tax=uncultured Methylibium sp. TaxID=381093 RepID=UPI0025DF7369|nr:NRDE family protein [uncultured Methylibium sp.]
MCLVALALDQDRRFPLVLASNRDEFFDRPAARLGWWTPEGGGSEILSGRDLQAGGTWLGLSAAGRLALVTNVRDPARHDPAAPSRGELVPRWLHSELPLDRFWMQVALSGYNGFNLIAADFARGDCFWASSAAALPRRLERGLYGLSNALLDTPWPKVARLKAGVQAAIGSVGADDDVDLLATRLFDALGDRSLAPDEQLPDTGVPRELERQLSAAFIRTPDGRYGTRCSTLVITERIKRQLVTHVFERSYTAGPGVALLRRSRLNGWPPRYSASGTAGRMSAETVPAGLDEAAAPAAAKRTRARGVIKPSGPRTRY